MNLIENVVWFTPKNAFTKELTWLPALFIHARLLDLETPSLLIFIFSVLTNGNCIIFYLACPVYRQRLLLPAMQ